MTTVADREILCCLQYCFRKDFKEILSILLNKLKVILAGGLLTVEGMLEYAFLKYAVTLCVVCDRLFVLLHAGFVCFDSMYQLHTVIQLTAGRWH